MMTIGKHVVTLISGKILVEQYAPEGVIAYPELVRVVAVNGLETRLAVGDIIPDPSVYGYRLELGDKAYKVIDVPENVPFVMRQQEG